MKTQIGLSIIVAASLVACTAESEGLGDGGAPREDGTAFEADAEAGVPDVAAWQVEIACSNNGNLVPYGMAYASHCNECKCLPSPGSCSGSTCQGPCTAASCDGGPRTCSTTDPCPRGGCFYEPGCAQPSGNCADVQTQCNPPAVESSLASGYPAMLFCGCDGRTYTGNCPMVPYAHTGPCP